MGQDFQCTRTDANSVRCHLNITFFENNNSYLFNSLLWINKTHGSLIENNIYRLMSSRQPSATSSRASRQIAHTTVEKYPQAIKLIIIITFLCERVIIDNKSSFLDNRKHFVNSLDCEQKFLPCPRPAPFLFPLPLKIRRNAGNYTQRALKKPLYGPRCPIGDVGAGRRHVPRPNWIATCHGVFHAHAKGAPPRSKARKPEC